MKRIMALVLVLTLFCTTAFATEKEEKQTMDSVVLYAKTLAAVIAYTADEPVSGEVEEVIISGKKIKVHSEFKYAMDVYYEFFRVYYECMNSRNLAALTRMMELTKDVDEIRSVLEKIEDMELSEGDTAYYLEVYSEIFKLMGGDFSSSGPSSNTDANDYGLDDLQDLINSFDFK